MPPLIVICYSYPLHISFKLEHIFSPRTSFFLKHFLLTFRSYILLLHFILAFHSCISFLLKDSFSRALCEHLFGSSLSILRRHFYSCVSFGFCNGNRITSRIDVEFVRSIISLSIPTPNPPAGGIPYLKALIKSVSITAIVSSCPSS